jgi:peroxiredoxin
MRLDVLLLGFVLLFSHAGHAGNALAGDASDSPSSHPLPVGSVMPDLLLRGELSPQHREHLGLKEPAPHSLSAIKARTIILVAFSMYCPHCQREAPALNELNDLIASRGLAGDVKLIGVGIGNSDFEVGVFQKKYAVNFPLFSDPDFKVNKDIGEVGTPFFYVLNADAEKKEIRVVDTLLGRMESAEAFLDQALKAAGR